MTSQPPIVRQEPLEPPRVGAAALSGSNGQPVAGDRPPSKLARLLDSKLAMLAMLFLATAALGLPFLWRSRRFSRQEKVVWSIVVSIYTALVFWAFGAVMWWSYARISESLA